MRKTALFAAALAALLACAACSTAKSYWKSTRATISPDPEVDLNTYNFDNPSERKLASLLAPVDAQLAGLIRFIETQDSTPEEDWLDLLMLRFPWLNGVLVAGTEGAVSAQRPVSDRARHDVGPLLQNATDWRLVKLRSSVTYSDFGPVMYLGRPFFLNTEWQGLLVVHFDPRALLNACPKPNQLVIVDPGNAVWTDALVDREAVLRLPWPDMLAKDVGGEIQVGAKPYTWFARFLAEKQIVYMAESIPGQGKYSFFGLF